MGKKLIKNNLGDYYMDYNYIKENLTEISKKIKDSRKKSMTDDVTLIGVTKTVPSEEMQYLNRLGIRDFGENRVQELISKYNHFDTLVKWHQIGHLQTNKVKHIIDKVTLIHSVENLKLAKEINRCAKNKEIIMDILLEINIANEESKFGLVPDSVFEFAKSLYELKNISIKGIMTIAPFVSDAEENRKYFSKMKKIFNEFENIKQENLDMKYLSMGMTNDYCVAIEEGANMVRIGTGIFGNRK